MASDILALRSGFPRVTVPSKSDGGRIRHVSKRGEGIDFKPLMGCNFDVEIV
jgi:hypothetical protein